MLTSGLFRTCRTLCASLNPFMDVLLVHESHQKTELVVRPHNLQLRLAVHMQLTAPLEGQCGSHGALMPRSSALTAKIGPRCPLAMLRVTMFQTPCVYGRRKQAMMLVPERSVLRGVLVHRSGMALKYHVLVRLQGVHDGLVRRSDFGVLAASTQLQRA